MIGKMEGVVGFAGGLGGEGAQEASSEQRRTFCKVILLGYLVGGVRVCRGGIVRKRTVVCGVEKATFCRVDVHLVLLWVFGLRLQGGLKELLVQTVLTLGLEFLVGELLGLSGNKVLLVVIVGSDGGRGDRRSRPGSSLGSGRGG